MWGNDELDIKLKEIREKLIREYEIKRANPETWSMPPGSTGKGSKVAPIRRRAKPKKYRVL